MRCSSTRRWTPHSPSGDQVIAITEDDDTLVLRADAGGGLPDTSALANRERLPAAPERILILGWNGKAQAIIEELDNYVAPGSETIVICRHEGAREVLVSVARRMQRQKVRFADGDITHAATLAAVKATSFEHVILLSYDMPIQEADAKTLITLLHLRNLADAAGVRLSIVSEMMDLRNRALAQIARADDFIVSDKLVSLMMSQLSENKNLDRGIPGPVQLRGFGDIHTPDDRLHQTGQHGRFLHRARGGGAAWRNRDRLSPHETRRRQGRAGMAST